MVNVSITSTCNRNCSYCFAKDTMDQATVATMSADLFDATLDFIQQNGLGEVRILGGEPTIHPRFMEFVHRALSRNIRVLVFSGGLIPRRALDEMQRLSPDELQVLLNVAIPGESPEHEINRQREVMVRLGERIVLGINIHSPGVELMFLLRLIASYGLAKQVRLGLTHPMMNGENVHLHPSYFDEVGRRVAEFVRAAQGADVGVAFDCGWVPCMFPEGSLEELGITPEEVGLRCNPILDVLSNGDVISCYPMGDYHKERLADWADVGQLADRFSERLSPLRPIGIFQRCAECKFRERGECLGGCLALSMQRLRGHDFEIDMKGSRPDQPRPEGFPSLPILSAVTSGCCGSQTASGSGGLSHTGCDCHSASQPPGESVDQRDDSEVRHALAKERDGQPLAGPATHPWSIPYIDQPMSFWDEIESEFATHVHDVYLPLADSPIGSGRPPLPCAHVDTFLRDSRLDKSVLLNVATFAQPVPLIAPAIIDSLKRAHAEYGITQAVVANLQLAQRIRDALPEFSLTASVLMEITHAYQARLLNGVCSTLVPGSGIVRDLPALRAVRSAFHGRIRLLVNEACLPLCPHRSQHFREMAEGVEEPKSLCLDMLADEPWLRLTGSWVLPQHLHLLEAVFDELKLAGRVTLSDPANYKRVLRAYIHRRHLLPHEIGGGPASVLEPIDMPEDLYQYTLECGRQCHQCTRCPDYYAEAIAAAKAARTSVVPHSI